MNRWKSLCTVVAVFLASCQENDLGTGANTVVRDYSKPASEAYAAALKSVEAAGLTVMSKGRDRMGGDLVACRANGSEVRIEVKSLDERTSRVSVRVGSGDRDLAKQLHEKIAERVGLGEASAGAFRGNFLEGSYTADLATGMTWSRRAYEALEVTPTAEETHATWAKLDGRLKDSTPVRIRMEKKDDLKISVNFIAGNERSDDNQDFVRRMKEEFEKRAQREGSGK